MMMMMKTTLVLALICLSMLGDIRGTLFRYEQCSVAQLERCLEPMSQVTHDPNLAFPVNSDQLEVTCNLLGRGDQCIEYYLRRCTRHEMNTMLWGMIQGAKVVLQHLCQPSQIQINYLLYADCFKRIATGPCYKTIDRFQNVSREFAAFKYSMGGIKMARSEEPKNEMSNMDKHLGHFCCSYKQSIECQLNFVLDICGKEAKEFFAYYMREISKQVLTEHCLGYTYSDRCNHTNNVHHHQHNKSSTSATPENTSPQNNSFTGGCSQVVHFIIFFMIFIDFV